MQWWTMISSLSQYAHEQKQCWSPEIVKLCSFFAFVHKTLYERYIQPISEEKI